MFLYSNDGIAWLTDSKAAAKFGGKYREEIEATNSPEILQSLMLGDDLYGVPYTTNTWYMFYDKSVFSEEDVKNLDTMLEKGVVSFPFTNSWYLPAFYVGNGCTLFGDGTDESAGVDFTGDKAYEVTDYLIDLDSSNDTWLNNRRITPGSFTRLRNGDQIALAKAATFVLRTEKGSA